MTVLSVSLADCLLVLFYLVAVGGLCYAYCMMSTLLIAILYAKLHLYRQQDIKTTFHDQKLQEEEDQDPDALPGVSVIKPLCGVDPNVRENLWTLFHMDYPQYEILFCVADPEDPVCPLVEQLIQQHLSSSSSQVSARLLTGGNRVGVNHKVNNMNQGYLAAKYPFLLISDSGIAMRQDTLKDMVQVMVAQPHTGLVHQIPYLATPRQTHERKNADPEAQLENIINNNTKHMSEEEAGVVTMPDSEDNPAISSSSLTLCQAVQMVFFGGWHARMYLCAAFLGINCTSGMSCLFRKEALEEAGGLAPFARYLAEDFFMSKFMHDNKWRVALSHQPAWQNSLALTLKQFHTRLVRWQQLRLMMSPFTTVTEPFTNCSLVVGILTVAWYMVLPALWPFCPQYIPLVILGITLSHLTLWVVLDYLLLRHVHPPHEPFLLSPFKFLQAWLYREFFGWPLQWAQALMKGSRITWREHAYRLMCGGRAEEVAGQSEVMNNLPHQHSTGALLQNQSVC